MKRSTRWSRIIGSGSLGVGVLAVLAVAGPAGAATTHADLGVVAVDTTDENFSLGGYPAWAPAGPATFPSIVASSQVTSYAVLGFQPDLTGVAEECSVEFLSFTVEIEALQTLQDQVAQIGFFVGAPAEPVANTQFSFTGTGAVVPQGGGFFAVSQAFDELDGTLTLTLPSAIEPGAVPFGWVGLDLNGPGLGPLWQIDSVSYGAEVTCPDLEPGPEQGADPSLPATGPGSAALIGAAGFVLVGAGAVLILRPRRAPRH